MSGLPNTLLAAAALVTSIATLISVIRVHGDVRTGNSMRAGALLSANETRRIQDINPSDRTDEEVIHLEQVPPVGKHYRK